MSEDIASLNKINKLFLATTLTQAEFYQSVIKFIENSDEDEIRDVIEKLENFENVVEALKLGVQKALEEAVGVENDQVDVTPTENGFKIIT